MFFRKMRNPGSNSESELIAAIDIGTSKICCTIAKVDSPDSIRVIGVGHQASKGLKSGNVIDMQDAELSILNSVHLAEQMAKETIRYVYVNIPNCYSQTVSVELPISGHSIDDVDVKKLLMMSREAAQPLGQEPIHTIPTSYDIDGRRGIRDPRGMYGDALGVNIHTIYSHTNNLRNLHTCISRCHLTVKSFVSTSLASGLSALIDDEMDLGVIVVDMGAGTTTVGIFYEGNITHTDYIPMGGNHVTSDIARVLSTPLFQAERIKTLHGSAIAATTDEREMIKVAQIGDAKDSPTNQIAKADLVRIIRPRIEENFERIRSRLAKAGVDKKACNRIVLTGGASQLPGIQDVANSILDKPIRLGKPIMTSLHDSITGPAFSAGVGLLQFAHLEKTENMLSHQLSRTQNSVADKLTNWFKDNI